jgi:hypothetical protein
MRAAVRYMLRPVAHCKEGCNNESWGMTLNCPGCLCLRQEDKR